MPEVSGSNEYIRNSLKEFSDVIKELNVHKAGKRVRHYRISESGKLEKKDFLGRFFGNISGKADTEHYQELVNLAIKHLQEKLKKAPHFNGHVAKTLLDGHLDKLKTVFARGVVTSIAEEELERLRHAVDESIYFDQESHALQEEFKEIDFKSEAEKEAALQSIIDRTKVLVKRELECLKPLAIPSVDNVVKGVAANIVRSCQINYLNRMRERKEVLEESLSKNRLDKVINGLDNLLQELQEVSTDTIMEEALLEQKLEKLGVSLRINEKERMQLEGEIKTLVSGIKSFKKKYALAEESAALFAEISKLKIYNNESRLEFFKRVSDLVSRLMIIMEEERTSRPNLKGLHIDLDLVLSQLRQMKCFVIEESYKRLVNKFLEVIKAFDQKQVLTQEIVERLEVLKQRMERWIEAIDSSKADPSKRVEVTELRDKLAKLREDAENVIIKMEYLHKFKAYDEKLTEIEVRGVEPGELPEILRAYYGEIKNYFGQNQAILSTKERLPVHKLERDIEERLDKALISLGNHLVIEGKKILKEEKGNSPAFLKKLAGIEQDLKGLEGKSQGKLPASLAQFKVCVLGLKKSLE